MQSAYILDVLEPANDLIATMATNECQRYKSILTLPSGEYAWKKGYPISSFHLIMSSKINLDPVAERISGSTRPVALVSEEIL